MSPEPPVTKSLKKGSPTSHAVGPVDPPMIRGTTHGMALSHQGIQAFADAMSPSTGNTVSDALRKVGTRLEGAAEELHAAMRAILGADWTGRAADAVANGIATYSNNALTLAEGFGNSAVAMSQVRDAAMELKNGVPRYTVAPGSAPSAQQEADAAIAQELFQSIVNVAFPHVDNSFPPLNVAHNPLDGPAAIPGGSGQQGPGPAGPPAQQSIPPAQPAPAVNAAANQPVQQAGAGPNGTAGNGIGALANGSAFGSMPGNPAAHASTFPAGVSPMIASPSRVNPNTPLDKPDWLRSPLPPGQNPDGSPKAPLTGLSGTGPHRMTPGASGLPGARPARKQQEEERERKTPDYLKNESNGANVAGTNAIPKTAPPVFGA